MRRVVIVTGGSFEPELLGQLQEGDWLIGADRGALHLIEHGFRPKLAVGDFDSISERELEQVREGSEKWLTCDPIDKNETDTELAFRHALAWEPDEVVIMGALGTRFDHSLANVHVLVEGTERNVRCRLLDTHNQIWLVKDELHLQRADCSHFSYISLLPLTWTVTGIDLEGFEYPLHNATLKIGQSLGISNRLQKDEAFVRLRDGLLLVIQSRD
ncbi:thiamine diphosphokinase [Marinicrinis sediminis]|uniref:Thiamine diphosphokinase n=1 Tax=Marinicrinis sediminis TaxID=1652465 RepID=A0ABW5RDR7_9BACL